MPAGSPRRFVDTNILLYAFIPLGCDDFGGGEKCGVTELVTEDFSHGQNYDGVRAVNPFR
jgi:predicted nucleic acid-binding protein